MAKALFLEDLPIIGKYVRDLLANKVDKVENKGLSTNDYTTEEKTKLEELSNDYDDLTDKPSINGVTLSGSKTTEDLIPIGDGLNFNADGELEATGGSDEIVIEGSLTISNDVPTRITFQKSLNELYGDIDNAIQSGKIVIIKGESTSNGYHRIIFRLVEEYGKTIRNTHIFEAVCLDSSDGQHIATFRIRSSEGDLYTNIKTTIITEGTTDYTNLSNKPSINGVTLTGNKTSSDLGIESGESAIAITNANTLGVQNKQLLKLTIDRLKELNTQGTWSDNEYTNRGVTFTVDVNNGNVELITANGTTTGISKFIVDVIDAQPNTKYIVNGGCIDPNYEGEGHQHNFYVQVGSQYIYDEEDYEVETDYDFLSYSIYVQGTADGAEFLPMIRTVGNSNFAPYASTIDERIEVLKNADKNINDKLQGSKQASSTSGTIEIPDYGMTESIDMYFKPTQDLHGYDKPWAGGAGKNKLPLTVDNLKSANTDGTWSGNTYSVNGASYTIETDIDGNVTSINGVGNGSTGSNLYLYFALQAGSYSMTSGFSENQGSNDTLLLNSSSAVIARGNSGAPGQDFTLSDTSNVTWVFRVTGAQTFTCTPMIRLSTESDADFEPYSNICPISGQDNATFEWTGKNKLIYPYPTESASFGGVTWTITPNEIHLEETSTAGFTIVLAGRSGTTWGDVGNAIPLIESDGNYTFSGGTSKVPLVVFQYRNGVRFQKYRMTSATTIEIEASDLFEIGLAIQTGVTFDDSISPQIEYGNQATSYKPYTHGEASMDFGQTYYGGFCQFATGAIYSEWDYIASYNGETLPSEWMSDRDEYTVGTTPTIGAEVVYKTTPTMAVVRKGDMNLTDDYPMQFNGWLASVTYQPKNTVLLQAKRYTEGLLFNYKPFNYSTSEQIVGKWIDGKPLYQITKQWKVPAEVAGQWNNYSVGNLGQLDYINISELAFDYSTSNYRFGNTVGLGTMEVASSFEKVGARLGYNTESGNVFVQLENVGTTSPLYQYGGTLTVTIRYTKITN